MEHSDENARENIEVTVDACSEPKAKSAKDRKRGKDKVKPLAKVGPFSHTSKKLVMILRLVVGCDTKTPTNHDGRLSSKANRANS